MAVVGVESILYTSFIVNRELILCIRKDRSKVCLCCIYIC